MKSSHLSSKKINWSSPVNLLTKDKMTKTVVALEAAGIETLKDLIWILPLHIYKLPPTQSFEQALEGEYFKGKGKIVSVQNRANFWAKGKGKVVLQNITVQVKDSFSSNTLQLKWFNTYPSVVKKIKSMDEIEFMGKIQIYQGKEQIINPEFGTPSPQEDNENYSLKIQYPTVNKISGQHILKIIRKIPRELWDNIPETISDALREKRKLLPLAESFKIVHGIHSWSKENERKAKERLIYEEFFSEQVKVFFRRELLVRPKADIFEVDSKKFNEILTIFPYELTKDQLGAVEEIRKDFRSAHPMMRLLQGDVGCGKTSVALIAALITIENEQQCALMCPTEALALQHFLTVSSMLSGWGIKIALLLGSTKNSEKNEIYEDLKSGKIDFIIGTHSLIQDSVQFKKLGLAIIDEQHKFGVDQRLKLVRKSEGTHCLIMTATPIPRSLSLTQYGDLDISTIRTMPSSRKGQKTRIISKANFQKFLSFVKTRLSMKEQVYVVVPAIQESETLDIAHLEETLEKFKNLFPDFQVVGLHGKMKSSEKESVFRQFKSQKIDILISTSVIEVGIDVPNATVMAIMDPERFGLSSLHQLRGRVGRGKKAGFCFLVSEKEISADGMKRLSVIEKTTDGFVISEEDLKIRGEGDLFGKSQSGAVSTKKIANVFVHQDILYKAREDVSILIKEDSPFIQNAFKDFSKDKLITTTI